MKKTILYSCVAMVALSVGIAEAQVAPVAPKAEVKESPVAAETTKSLTTDEIKAAYIQSVLSASPMVGQLYDLNGMKVEQDGKNFLIQIAGVPQKMQSVEAGKEAKVITLPDIKIPLIYAGEFNGQAQYQVGDAWNNFEGFLKTFFPEASMTSEKHDFKSVWVPAYKLSPQRSVNIQKLKATIPNEAELTVDSMVSDALARVVSADKMDAATMADVKNVVVKREDMTISIPAMTMKQNLMGSPISGDPAVQTFNSEKSTFEFDVPALVATMTGNPEPMLTMALKGDGSFEKNVFKYNGSIHNIHLGKGLPIPSLYIPTTATINLEIDNLTKEFYDKMVAINAIQDNQEEFVKQTNEAVKDLVFKINNIELKNAQAGLSLSGVSKAEMTQNKTYVQGFDGKLTITNLDQLSPVPKVDEAACQEAKKNAPNMDKETANQMVAYACTPRGGMLDILRPYMKAENRQTAADGTTTDTIAIRFGANGFSLNGTPVQLGTQAQ